MQASSSLLNQVILDVKDLSIDYVSRSSKQRVHALRKLSLSVSRGEIVGIVGESGSGKSTLALAIARLLDDRVASYEGGSIEFLETDMLGTSSKNIDRIRGTEIFMIFQDPFLSLNPLMKIKDQIVEAIRIREKRSSSKNRVDKDVALKEAVQVLKDVRIDDAEDVARRYPHQLSGGQNQRVMLAMALAERPKLLIADEPTTALDVTTQAQVLNLLREIVQRTRMSVIFITHDLAVAGWLCDRIIVLYGGVAQEVGPAKEVLNHPKHPYTIGLIKSVPSKTKRDGELEAIPGAFYWEDTGRMCAFAPRCPDARQACRDGVPALIEVSPSLVRCLNYGTRYEEKI